MSDMNTYYVKFIDQDWSEKTRRIDAASAKEVRATFENVISVVKVGAALEREINSEVEEDREREEAYHTLIEQTGNIY
jgi:hypothetical protein